MGADVNAKGGAYGGTPLMRSASSELATADMVRLLLERGANANAESTQGERPLDWAIYRGDRAKIAVLETYGATRGRVLWQSRWSHPPRAARQSDPRASVARSVSPLLKTAPPMYERRQCYTCHHNTVPAEAAALSRSRDTRSRDSAQESRRYSRRAADDGRAGDAGTSTRARRCCAHRRLRTDGARSGTLSAGSDDCVAHPLDAGVADARWKLAGERRQSSAC